MEEITIEVLLKSNRLHICDIGYEEKNLKIMDYCYLVKIEEGKIEKVAGREAAFGTLEAARKWAVKTLNENEDWKFLFKESSDEICIDIAKKPIYI